MIEAALASIALAGNILQFIGVVRKFISKTDELTSSHDGSSKEQNELDVVLQDLKRHLHALDVDSDLELKPLLTSCRSIGEDIQQALQRIGKSRSSTRWSSLRQALVWTWNRQKVEDLENRLEGLRNELGLALQMILRRDLQLGLQNVDDRVQMSSEEILQNQNGSLIRVQDCIRASEAEIIRRCEPDHLSASQLREEVIHLRSLLQQDSSFMSPPHSIIYDDSMRKAFLECLAFAEMDAREDNIAEAHFKTFEWVLSPDIEQVSEGGKQHASLEAHIAQKLSAVGISTPTTNLPFALQTCDLESTRSLQQWLKDGRGIFWIWGKPGCGKSTFMKALLYNEKLRSGLHQLLIPGGKSEPLLEASFFFFRPGMSLQKTPMGLYRSLLTQIIRQKPEALLHMFNETEQARTVERSKTRISRDPIWSLDILRNAFRRWRKVDKCALYLHIDGIDELDCDPAQSASILLDLAGSENVKILVAGRDHPEFQHAFDRRQQLALHELTEPDIIRYTVDQICTEDCLACLQESRQIIELLHEVIDSAKGVFLWVSLALSFLVRGTHYSETFDQLMQRLRQYPKDLDTFYEFIYEQIDTAHVADAAFWILSVYWDTVGPRLDPVPCCNNISVLKLWIADAYDMRDDQGLWNVLQRAGSVLESAENAATAEGNAYVLAHRIQKQCLHFFDISISAKEDSGVCSIFCSYGLTFSHRTILDFLIQNSERMLDKLSAQLHPRRNPLISNLAAHAFVSAFRLQSYIEVWPEVWPEYMLASLTDSIIRSSSAIDRQYAAPLFQQMHTIMRNMNMQHLSTHGAPLLIPTAKGWTPITGPELAAHLLQTESLVELLLLAFRIFSELWPPGSLLGEFANPFEARYIDGLRRHTDSLCPEQQQRIALLTLCHLAPDKHTFAKASKEGPFLPWQSPPAAVLRLLPKSPPFTTKVLERLGELIRIWFLLYVSGSRTSTYQVLSYLIEHGADPNVLCKGSALDPDPRPQTLLKLASRRKRRLNRSNLGVVPKEDYYRAQFTETASIERLLIDNGGKSRSVKAEDSRYSVDREQQELMRRIFCVVAGPKCRFEEQYEYFGCSWFLKNRLPQLASPASKTSRPARNGFEGIWKRLFFKHKHSKAAAEDSAESSEDLSE